MRRTELKRGKPLARKPLKPKKPAAKSEKWYRNLPERFWVKVNKDTPNGCWEWTGCLQSQGYGQFNLKGATTYTHRLVFFAKYGRWPENFVCHTCDNRKCCNPDHLFEGTGKDNSLDMWAKGRGKKPTKLTDDDVREIRRLLESGHRQGAAIGRQFGISKQEVCNIKKGRVFGGVH